MDSTTVTGLQVSMLRRAWVLLLLVAGIILSLIVPPGQSPDEHSHLLRAYWLSKGVITLNTPQGSSSGYLTDDGLNAYLRGYTFYGRRPGTPIDLGQVREESHLQWTGTRHFVDDPAVGYYFPLVYTPQAVALAIGERLHLDLDTSYRLARLCALLSVVAIILAALRTYPMNAFVAAVLLLPMCLFQDISASQDGVATALCVLGIALFMRGMDAARTFTPCHMAMLCLSIFLVATSRNNMLPMVLMPFAVALARRSGKGLAGAGVTLAACLCWTVIALKTTADLRVGRAYPTSFFIHQYFAHPGNFLQLLSNTLTNTDLAHAYEASFVGVFGWLEIQLPRSFYTFAMDMLLALGVLSLSVRRIRRDYATRLVLVLGAFSAMLLIFFALATTWTQWGAPTIAGVQGRYFTCPMLMLGYALSGHASSAQPGLRKRLAGGALAAFLLATSYVVPKTLIDWYYIDGPQRLPPPALSTLAKPFAASASVSGPLDRQTVSVHLQPDSRDAHLPGNSFIALLMPTGTLYLHQNDAWLPFDASQPLAYSSGMLETLDARLTVDRDLTDFRGARLLLGYGRGSTPTKSFNDMLAQGRYAQVYEVQ